MESMNQRIIEELKRITDEERKFLNGETEINPELYQSELPTDLYLIDSKKLLDAGKLITIRPNTRFVHFPAHRHNYVEVMYMCEGSTKHLVNGKMVELHKGELLFLNQNAVQEILPAEKQDIGVNFIILPEFFNYALGMMAEEESQLRKFVVDCLTGKNEEVSYLHFKVADVLPIQNLVENLIWTLLNRQQNKRSINEITMGLLLLQLMNHMDTVETNHHSKGQLLTMQVLQFIDANYKDGELSELAVRLHYDLAFLSKSIKKYTGSTYTELLQSKRLSQATYLLTHTAMQVSDISEAVGYENISYFHRVFKKKYGISPRIYRINNQIQR